VVSEIFAFKVADLPHGSNPPYLRGTRAHYCATSFDQTLMAVSMYNPAGHGMYLCHMHQLGLLIAADRLPGYGVWLLVHVVVDVVLNCVVFVATLPVGHVHCCTQTVSCIKSTSAAASWQRFGLPFLTASTS
jgi:hypothetical protein